MLGERNFDKHSSHAAAAPNDLSFDQILDQMSPKEVRARINAMAKEEAKHKEPSFDEALDSMSPREVRHRMRQMGQEWAKEKAQQEAEEKREAKLKREQELQNLDMAKLPEPGKNEKHKPAIDDQISPMHMTFDKKTNSYITDDGYILPGPKPGERISGYMLEDELKRIADVQESNVDSNEPSPQKQKQRQRSIEDQLIDLPAAGAIDYRSLAANVPVRQLYGPESSECSEFSVSLDARVAGFNGGSITIYDKQNEKCQLAQTVQQACAIPELLALDVQNARNVKEMLMKSDTVVTASKFCAETIDAVNAEKARLQNEKEEEEEEEEEEE
ncbi:MAG: hypothetical protein IPO31_11760 [Candidatus Obscuribacter sp.]|nr:hypothetical protein [Candidatus Obscuribacter sp.]